MATPKITIPLSSFHLLNTSPPLNNPPSKTPFTLSTPTPTDLWRKPPSINTSTAPTLYTPLPLHTFISARATISAPWKTLYDQGGLVMLFPRSGRWIKSGVEYVDGTANVSTVATDRWSDWSLLPLSKEAAATAGGKVTVEWEREEKEKGGRSLMVYVVEQGGKGRKLVREVTWVFENVEEDGEEEEVWVGAYVAKPKPDEGVQDGGGLKVVFEEFEVRVC